MPFRLSADTIKQRFIEWRNLKRLHSEQVERIRRLVVTNKALRQENVQLKAQLEIAFIRIGELEKMVFGQKRNKDSDPGHSSSQGRSDSAPQKPRSAASYQRSVPSEPPTTTTHIPITVCTHCQGQLIQVEEVVRYVEDIVLPQLLGKMTKTITKLVIERGYCITCGVWVSAQDLRGAVVTLGQNIKLLVCYLVTILDCSYEQVKTLTGDLYTLDISDGEITSILHEQSITWLPEYERLKEIVRAGPGAHMDETPWPIQAHAKHCYAWVMSALGSGARIYKLATSRGKDHARELLGEAADTYVRITDCYAAYKYLPGLHQICWAHLHRKIRDLVENKHLPTAKQPAVQQWYKQFSQVYEQLRMCLKESFHQEKRRAQTTQLRAKIHSLRQPNSRDPKKLANLKLLLIEYDHALFTCMQFEGVPCDNNRAEQDIRILVQKRKKCFGSRTEAGARAMEILLSVTWSTWHMHRTTFLPALAALNQDTD